MMYRLRKDGRLSALIDQAISKDSEKLSSIDDAQEEK